MAWLRLATVFALALGALVFSFWLWRRVERFSHFPRSRALAVFVGGGAFAVLASVLERWTLSVTGLSVSADGRQHLGPALAMVLFFAPLEEALKVACVWPGYVRRRLTTGQLGATYAVVGAGGFACAETLLWFGLWGQTSWFDVVRSGLALPAHFFFAGAWGYMLGGGRRDRWFGLVWLGCVLLHGLYDHIIFGRGPALWVAALPMLLLMGLGVPRVLREPSAQSGRPSVYSLFEGGHLPLVREVMDRKGRPLMVHWIFLGALVTLGVMLTFLALFVYLGHRLGVDFALADQPGMEGALPIALLGVALLAAFPFSAYLIARASGSVSVLEPAWATGAAIIVVLALFSVTEPTALVVALGIAPVGFALACAGAWFGLARR